MLVRECVCTAGRNSSYLCVCVCVFVTRQNPIKRIYLGARVVSSLTDLDNPAVPGAGINNRSRLKLEISC